MTQQEFDLTKLLKGLWRFAWIIALVALVAGGTAWRFTSVQPAVYEATATLMVESGQPKLAVLPSGLDAGLQLGYMQDVGSQIQVMQSRRVIEQAINQLEPEKARDPDYLQLEASNLQGSVRIQQVKGTSLVQLTVASSNPIKAQRQANAVAQAYVYEVGRTKLTAIETALENTTKQLKELSTSKIDLSVSASLTRVTAEVNSAVAALTTATEHLQRVGIQKVAQSPEKPVPLVNDAGTVLTSLQMSSLGQRVGVAVSEANELSTIAQRLVNWEPSQQGFELHAVDVTIMESQSRALATRLGNLSTEVEVLQRAETDPQLHDQLLAVEEQLGVASATAGALLSQVTALYAVEQQLRVATVSAGAIMDQMAALYGIGEQLRVASVTATAIPVQAVALQRAAELDLMRRIIQHTTVVANTLKGISGQLQQLKPRTATSKQWQLDSLSKTIKDRVSGRTASAIAVLTTISQQLRPLATEQGILLTHAELAAMASGARAVAANLTLLLSEVEGTQLNELAPEDYTELLSVREGFLIANDAAKGLPDQIAALEKEGGDSLGSAALDNLRQQLQLTLLTSSNSGARVMDTAAVSSLTTGLTGRLRSVILAVVAALLLAVLGVLVIQYFDRRVRDASQVTSHVGLSLLAQVAKIKGAGNPHPPSVLKETPPGYLEAFRMLRTNLGLDSRRGRVLLISSPGGKEGKTTVAVNLARAVALQGRKVLLIDGNLRKPEVAGVCDLTKANGLSEFLTGENELGDCIMQADGVDILPVAGASARSAEMLSSLRMKALLEKARQTYDVVIVDSAPVIGIADTQILAKEADEVLLVLQADESTLDLTKETKQALESAGARVAGFVLNMVKTKEGIHFRWIARLRAKVFGSRSGTLGATAH